MEQIGNMIRDGIKPDLSGYTAIEAVPERDKTVVKVTVLRGAKRPYHLTEKGLKSTGVFIRHGVSSVPATEEMIREMLRESDGVTFDKSRCINQDLTFEYAAKYFADNHVSFNENNKRTLHLIDADGYYTNAALLLSDQCEHSIKCAVYEGNGKTKFKTRVLTGTAMLAAVATVLMYMEFPIPIMPAFIKLDISDLPALLGTFSLGPVYGVAIQLVKNLLHLPFGSSAGVGELSNFLLGAVFAFIAGIVYKKHKNRGGALWGSVAGAAAMAVISIPINYFIVYPAYVVLYGLPLEAIVGMYQEILGTVAQVPTSNALLNCLMVFNVPFTLCKGLLDVALCFLIYKPLSPLLHK